MKTISQDFGLEMGKLLGFEHLSEVEWGDTETAIGIAHNKRGVQGEGPVSDRRLKTDVKPVGTTEIGLSLYEFRYVGSDETFRGLMAQDLLADGRYADAVETRGGYYCVNYERLGLCHLVTPEMCDAGERALAAATGPL